MVTRVPALIQPVDPRPAGLLLSDPRVPAQLVITSFNYTLNSSSSLEHFVVLEFFILGVADYKCYKRKVSRIISGQYWLTHNVFSNAITAHQLNNTYLSYNDLNGKLFHTLGYSY